MTTASIPRSRTGRLHILTDDRVAIRTGALTHILYTREIASVHASRNVTRIATRDGEMRVYLPFTTVFDALQPFGMVQVHRGSAVNIALVCRMIGRGAHRLVVVLENGAEHAVGRGFQSALRARINGVTR